jgi:ornithine cyclodeaminase/alanine dehydrogenase-like protein (mu-crystallin family)
VSDLKWATGEVLILSQSDMQTVLKMKDVLGAVEDAFKLQSQRQTVQPLKTVIHYSEGGKYRLTSLPCYVEKKGAGIKWVANNRDNRGRGLPTVSGVMILNDDETSIPVSIMDATWMTSMRTAGHATVAAKYLAKKKSSSVAIIGCGVEGRTHLEAMNEIFKLEEVKIYDKFRDYAEKYADDVEKKLNLKAQIAGSAKNAARDVDIICMTTTATKPVLMSDDVGRGCFVAGTAQFRDLDPKLGKEVDKWVVGDVESDFIYLGKSQSIMDLSKEDIYSELGEIIIGKKPGRETEEERILFSHAGMGALDVLTASLVYNKAKEKGIGLRVNLLK